MNNSNSFSDEKYYNLQTRYARTSKLFYVFFVFIRWELYSHSQMHSLCVLYLIFRYSLLYNRDGIIIWDAFLSIKITVYYKTNRF
jgi:hypothetical protein